MNPRSRVDTGLQLSPGRRAAKKRQPQFASKSMYFRDFVDWVLMKEKEDCVFWYASSKDLMSLSEFLERRLDPLGDDKYKPLITDPGWWRTKFDRKRGRFLSHPGPVLECLYTLSSEAPEMRGTKISDQAMQEIIYQSNRTLEPVLSWPRAPTMRFLPNRTHSGLSDQSWRSPCRSFIGSSYTATDKNGRVTSTCGDCRITAWPFLTKDRRDNLHSEWQRLAAISDRTSQFPFPHCGSSSCRASPRPRCGRDTSPMCLDSSPANAGGVLSSRGGYDATSHDSATGVFVK